MGLALAFLMGGCATPPGATFAGPVEMAHYRYFRRPAPSDPWSLKIASWQRRELAQPGIEELRAPASVSGSGEVRGAVPVAKAGDLRAKYFGFRASQKRAMAEELVRWMQGMAKSHYVPDGLVDHWATLEETLAANGDDCDGLELLAYHFLRDLGFRESEVYRAIVFRPQDGQHHMVTLWFESPDDPWVLDPTGAMTAGMPRMSERSEWVPLKLFSETEEYTVERIGTRVSWRPAAP